MKRNPSLDPLEATPGPKSAKKNQEIQKFSKIRKSKRNSEIWNLDVLAAIAVEAVVEEALLAM